ncbi:MULTISPECIES: class F sortase [Pseudonocardia]|uniref:Sortase family protein n=2 Tax=Pseudonocardia TaxID=1847 RepID=A0A1Y2MJH2_PSEAH|nr:MULTISPECIES: class F sortase [Pseudonocardia]OSY35312.1 Sortase family protein [Pseudonocardia autotrophica]TDN73249.1 LPXTG-site transpeptidase (sortase) family protein [Pseudonocardia autotrophica]BBG03982.1 class F sortase [Pseudonocardia autotrophica]GEC27765.1 class F sortase [Pseudonocardia saturnea]
MRRAEYARDRRPGATLLPGVVALLLLLTACGMPAASDAPDAPEPPAAPMTQEPVVAQAGEVLPTSLRIPAIGVDEPELIRLGVAEDNTAEVPQDFDRVGWFDRGANPGPTVLLGHVDSRAGPAVFFDLRDLEPGDVIEVGHSDGSLEQYVVERTRQMPKDEFPTFEVFGATSSDVLRLVTCAGDFDRGERSYVDNLVVHARAG